MQPIPGYKLGELLKGSDLDLEYIGDVELGVCR